MKQIIAIGGIVLLIGLVVYLVFLRPASVTDVRVDDNVDVVVTPPAVSTSTPVDQVQDEERDESEANPARSVIGSSVNEHDIIAYHFGTGEKEILFVGGIHGGYSWNTALLGFELVDYLEKTPTAIPQGVRVTVIPVLNPDGLMKTVGTTERFASADVPTGTDATVPGRFNGNTVDLNRNFDCDWRASGVWQNRAVSGGGKAFSEPESQAIKAYVESHDIAAAVVWYSAAGGVYASECQNGILPETRSLMNTYARAAGYPAYDNFDSYAINGDMTNWLAKISIPAISVLLTTHSDTEWSKNRAGIEAVLKSFAE